MDHPSLKLLLETARSVAPDAAFVVFGSTSAFATWPDLSDHVHTYLQTRDTDLILNPWDQETARLLHQSIGRLSAFDQHHGIYADIISPAAFHNFPADFRDRLVPLPGCPNVSALDPHDMAIAKLFAGRPKDLQLLSILLATGRLDEARVRRLLWSMEMEEKWIVKTNRFLDDIVEAAWALGYPLRNVKDTWPHS
jgi:hypothetical protein